MARFGDRGAYEVGNVRMITNLENARERGALIARSRRSAGWSANPHRQSLRRWWKPCVQEIDRATLFIEYGTRIMREIRRERRAM
jgi:hypothetical protein